MIVNAIVGFIAGAISVLAGHQPVLWLFKIIGWVPQFVPYNMAPFAGALPLATGLSKMAGLAGFPILFNLVFWGGVWGTVFAIVHRFIPGPMIVRGIVYGAILVIVSNWIVIPTLRGQPLFAGYDPMRLMIGGLLQMAFGAGIAIVYSVLRPADTSG